ncbi:MAG: 50S ribosomal protein L22 [Candidatus Omnitrophica bacterium]|nr:50S ribosomal protein L22 [Candidatus Omnitrophota bacterium]
MISTAKVKYVRMSPTKVRYVLDQVRNKPVLEALATLNRSNRRAALPVKKLILSAVDNAVKRKSENSERLKVSKIYADGAGIMKRWRAMTMGRAGSIHKRLSHISVELDLLPGVDTVSAPAPAKKETKKRTKKAVGAKS